MLQSLVIEQYLRLKNKPNLKTIANETGINITRIFRLMNGSEMKVKEYEVFKKIVSGCEVLTLKKCLDDIELDGNSGILCSLEGVLNRAARKSKILKSENPIKVNRA